MTAWLLFGAVRRHRLTALAGLLLTVGAVLWAGSGPGVYYQRVNVILLAPPPPTNDNVYQVTGESLIASASILRLETAGPPGPPQPVSPKITIVDEGVVHGTAIRMPNSGGQWAYVYDRPVLDVQVAGTSPQEVQTSMRAVISRIENRLKQDQDAFATRADQRIDTALSPPVPPLLYRQGSRVRAVAIALLLGVALTMTAVVAVDRWAFRRLLRRAG